MTNQSKETSLYFTSDLGIAVYLFTTGYSLVKTELISREKLTFHFQKQDKIENDVASFLNGTGLASAKRLFENYRTLRALAFEKTNNLTRQ